MTTELIKTRKQYEETLDFLKMNRLAYDEGNEIDDLIEALREVVRDTQKFGEYDTPNLLRVIADDYERDGSPVWKARAMWLRDLAAKFAKYDFPDWIKEDG